MLVHLQQEGDDLLLVGQHRGDEGLLLQILLVGLLELPLDRGLGPEPAEQDKDNHDAGRAGVDEQ